MSVEAVKQKLLMVANLGVYFDFTPPQIQAYTREVVAFLKNHKDVVDNLEYFNLLELQFWLDIFTSRDVDAKIVLDRISDQFALVGQLLRLKILQLAYYEAQGDTEQAQKVLGDDANELRVQRRLTTFKRHDPEAYIAALNSYLDTCGLDLMAWSELATQYTNTGHYDMATYCYQEILLQEPHAYPFFYRAGTSYYHEYLQRQASLKPPQAIELLQNALNHFCRSVELCHVYDNGWRGIKTLVDLGVPTKAKAAPTSDAYAAQLAKLKPLIPATVSE